MGIYTLKKHTAHAFITVSDRCIYIFIFISGFRHLENALEGLLCGQEKDYCIKVGVTLGGFQGLYHLL